MGFIKSTFNNAVKHKSIMRMVNISLALLFVTSLTLNIASNNGSADAAVKRQCVSPNTGQTLNLTKEVFQPASIAVNGSQAVATFKFPGQCAGQNIDIALVSYKAPNSPDNQPFSAQRVFDVRTESYNVPRNGAQLTVNLPDCKYQVDLVLGGANDVITQFSDGHGSANTYSGQGRMITAIGGGSGECFPAAPAPAAQPAAPAAPATPSNVCVTNSCNTTTINQTNNNNTEVSNSPNTSVNTQQGNAAGVSNGGSSEAEVDQEINSNTSTDDQKNDVKVTTKTKGDGVSVTQQSTTSTKGTPKELPNTGPGAIAPILFGTSFMSSMLFSYRRRYSDIVASLVARF